MSDENELIDGADDADDIRDEKASAAETRAYVDALLGAMRQSGASDLFLASGFRPSVKHNGEMKPLVDQVLDSGESETLAYSLMNEHQRREFDHEHECNFAIAVQGLGRFRVNVYVQQQTVSTVIRTIAESIPNIDEMGLPEILKELSMKKRGLVLLVGATGSGKSTTLAAMVDHRNANSSGHIITIEDPIEYAHQPKRCLISHREVGVDTKSWHSALKNTLRQAPDVILIGEIRDHETMESAIALAETGHLCLSTLHANSANQALDRIINFFPEEKRNQILMDLSSNMQAIVSQRLPRTRSGGRAAAIEIMINTKTVSERILKGEFHGLKEIMVKSENIGMRTFDGELFKMYEDDQIPYSEALRNSDNPTEIRLALKLKSVRAKSDPDSPFFEGRGDDETEDAPDEAEKEAGQELVGGLKPAQEPAGGLNLSLVDLDDEDDKA